jgi:hypothetical protein
MAKKATDSARKQTSRKTAKKAPVKKALKVKKTAKKKALKKKALKKKVAKKTAAKRVKKAEKVAIPLESVAVEPGPPPGNIPSVEEPVSNEEALGTVTHYYSNLGVAIIQINKKTINTGDRIHIKGHTTDFTQMVQSMEYEHQHVDQASAGQSVGIKVNDHAREHDIVYRVA